MWRQNPTKRIKSQGRTLAPNWEEFADGRILSGKQAWIWLVDELGSMETGDFEGHVSCRH